MSFHASSSDIRIEERDGATFLVAEATNEAGAQVLSELKLDDCIGNDNGTMPPSNSLDPHIAVLLRLTHLAGHFQWGAENFTQSAQNISLSLEGPGVPVLRAELKSEDGEWIHSDINLAEMIENQNGRLSFLG